MSEVVVFLDSQVSIDVAEQLRQMVVAAFEGEFGDDDWEHAKGGWRVVAFRGGAPVAHAAVVARQIHVGTQQVRTGYVEAVATAPELQRQRLGSAVMGRASWLIRRTYEMGALSTAVPAFYEPFGWERWQGPSFVRDGETQHPTADEDDGIMVLRFGVSADVDLQAPIACDQRPGDAW